MCRRFAGHVAAHRHRCVSPSPPLPAREQSAGALSSRARGSGEERGCGQFGQFDVPRTQCACTPIRIICAQDKYRRDDRWMREERTEKGRIRR